MKFTSTVLSLLLSIGITTAAPTCTVGISPVESLRVQQAFVSSGVVPTLIPAINPRLVVDVTYGNKAVDLGNEFTTAQTLAAPALSFDAELGFDPATTKYSYFLIDPDVPAPNGGGTGIRTTYLHWYVDDAQPYCINNQNPKTITLYQSLTPTSIQQHRYTFLVYRQPPGYQANIIGAQARAGFNVNTYAANGGLTLVGGNFLREAITNT